MGKRIVKLGGLTVVALMLALVSGLTIAEATHTVKIASHITIKSNGLQFSGRVKAKNAACESGRKVTLYRKPSMALGSTTTNSSGHWKIMASGFAGISQSHFFARVKRESDGTAGTIYVCKAARSKTIPFHQ